MKPDNYLDSKLVEKIVEGVREFIDSCGNLGDPAIKKMLLTAVSRDGFFPADVQREIRQGKGDCPTLTYLCAHKEFAEAFGNYFPESDSLF